MTTQERYDLIGRLYAEGQSIEEIAKAVGRKHSTVYRALNRIGYDKRYKPLDKEKEEIEGLIEAGHTITEIAKATGHDTTVLRDAFKRWGISLGDANRHITAQSREAREQRIIDTIQRQTFFRIEYKGGFVDSLSNLKLHCTECGMDFTLSADRLMRSDHILECPGCIARDRSARQKAKKRRQRIEQQKRADYRLIVLEAKKLALEKKSEARKRICACGEPYIYSGQGRGMCTKCRNKADNKNRELKRRIKITAAMVDKDITLDRLIARQGWACQLCGELTDPTDFEIREDGTIVAGDKYPSIDHVIPLSKGGQHSWDNVQVACRFCNSIKSDSLV